MKLKIRPHGRDNEWTEGKKKNTINAIVSAEQKNIEASKNKEKEKQTNGEQRWVRETECKVFKELY